MTASTAGPAFVDRDRVHAARRALQDESTLRTLSDIFKVLGDPSRLKLCLALSRRELCVSDIAGLLGLTESAVSHQLRLLKAMRVVKYRKEGKMTYYMLDDDHVEELIHLSVRHVTE
jgi:ArsR family transcriptional regulator, lead/cadmium/zinc/bismuth-responsive transcriptional repressor